MQDEALELFCIRYLHWFGRMGNTEWTLCLVQFYVLIFLEKIGLTFCILGIYQSKFIKGLWTIYKLKLV
jgi:hypothetical protein